MSFYQLLYIFIGGGLGSITRFGVSYLTVKLWKTNLPLGTLMTNILACVLLGLLLLYFKGKVTELKWLYPLLITGFCGGFSTFSTFSYETMLLLQQGQVFIAIANIVISILAGVSIVYMLSTAS